MLRFLAISLAALLVSLSVACSSTNVTGNLVPVRETAGYESPSGGNDVMKVESPSGGNDVMSAKATSGYESPSGGNDVMKVESPSGGNDVMAAPAQP